MCFIKIRFKDFHAYYDYLIVLYLILSETNAGNFEGVSEFDEGLMFVDK